MQRLRTALHEGANASGAAVPSEAERAETCARFFVNRPAEMVRKVEEEYALGFEHTLEHDLGRQFHGVFLECLLRLLGR